MTDDRKEIALARSDDEYWSVSVEFNGENILTIGQSKYSGDLSGIPNIEDYADVVRAASTHLASFIGPDELASCFICGGDCASANPPVIDCPMRSPLHGGEAVSLSKELNMISETQALYPMGTRVRKKSGSRWQGHVVGYYSTTLTPHGVAIESETEKGSVQIYPVKAIEVVHDQ